MSGNTFKMPIYSVPVKQPYVFLNCSGIVLGCKSVGASLSDCYFIICSYRKENWGVWWKTVYLCKQANSVIIMMLHFH